MSLILTVWANGFSLGDLIDTHFIRWGLNVSNVSIGDYIETQSILWGPKNLISQKLT